MKGKKRVVVIGAGIAGLTLSYNLSRAGHDVLLVEREAQVGGLAKSYAYGSGYTFDAGPHRFYTDNAKVHDFILEVLEDDHVTLPRKSGVWMFNRYFDWPLKAASALRMPVPVLFSVAMDMLNRQKPGEATFEQYIISRYGKTLYSLFFKEYTEKFLDVPCSEISRDWAITGIDRSVIDKNLNVSDLYALAKSLLTSRGPLKFIYPRSGGIGVFSEKLKKKIEDLGGLILLKAEVSQLGRHTGRIVSVMINGQEHDCDLLVWTGSINDLSPLLHVPTEDLSFRSLIIYNYCLEALVSCHYQWCYFGASEVPFNRISIPALFNDSMAPTGKAGICVEVTCQQGDELWRTPGSLEPRIRQKLQTVGLIDESRHIRECHIERLSNAYPVYTLNYEDKVNRMMAAFQQYQNLRVIGRTGAFYYNNMDHSIEEALSLADEIGGK